MSSLKFGDKKRLEEFLGMSQGYVLNFVDRTFSDFFRDFDIEIDDEKYRDGNSGSKANRMRAFWACEPDQLVGEVLQELVDYAESYRPDHPGGDDCRAIASRLLFNKNDNERPRQAASKVQKVTPRTSVRKSPVEIFFSYAHEDEKLMDMVRLQLVVQERLGAIVKWHDRMIPAGNEWRTKIDERINRAHVILLFMSPDFIASRYCYEIEGDIALRRHREGTAKVIPVVLRACDWTITPFGELQGLPQDGKPITQWSDKDQVSLDVARGIMDSIREL